MSTRLEVQGIATDRQDTFPYSGMRLLGCIQIITGILVFVLGVVDLVLTMSQYDSDKVEYGSTYDSVVSLTVASSPLWCGMWFAITGALGTCITRDRAHTLQFFKIGFLVLNILCCALFGPVCAIVAAFIGYSRHTLDDEDLQWLVHLIICFLATLEVVMSTVSAAVTCCCAPLKSTQIHVIVNPQGVKGGANPFLVQPDSRGVATRGLGSGKSQSHNDFITDNSVPNNDKVDNLRDSNYKEMAVSAISNPRDMAPNQSPVMEMSSSRQRRPRVEMDEPIIDGFSDSSGYPKLKKWALPHW